jgi:membrane protease YdiL (CAAX protease family)
LNKRHFRWPPLLGTVALATFFWFVIFYISWGIFWFKISFSAASLAGLSLWLQSDQKERILLDGKSVAMGLFSAAALYLIFWIGKVLSTAIFSFGQHQIGAIYLKGEGTPLWVIALLLFFITGPGEELYWRGYLQRNLMRRFGGWQGWLLATVVYAGVHLWSFNFMLVGAAGVAGAYWGAMYWRVQNLNPVIISHSIWSTVVFTVFPMS